MEVQEQNLNAPPTGAKANAHDRVVPVATKDVPGPPFLCPECNESFTDKRPLGQHRSIAHGYRSPSAIYSHDLYLKQKARRLAEGLSSVPKRPYKKQAKAKPEQETMNVQRDTDADHLDKHIAFAAGYITCFIETYAKGNGLSGPEFTRRLAEFIHAKSR